MDKLSGIAHSPLGKFSPPSFDPRNLLDRSVLITSMIEHLRNTHQPIFIQAQAGQGKSTLAGLTLQRIGKPFCWYQLDPRDRDPVYLLSSIYRCLSRTSNGFESELAATTIAKQELSAENAPSVFSRMLRDLDAFLKDEFFIVLDDLHLLEGAAQSCALIAPLLINPPQFCRLLLVSRRPVAGVLGNPSGACNALIIDNPKLALSRSQTAEYYNTILAVAVSPEMVQQLHRLTEGWIMGLALAGGALRRDPAWILETTVLTAESLPASDVFDYLFREIISEFPPELHQALLELAILPEASVGLAEGLGYRRAVIESLRDLVRQNSFMRFSTPGEDEIVIHHLLHECLQTLAMRELSESRRRVTFQVAARWNLSRNRSEAALQCYMAGRWYPKADQVLQQVGLSLFANNRLVSLAAALEPVPDEIIRGFPWLSYFQGIVRLSTDPPSALAYFNAARRIFETRGNELGELLVLAQIIYYHITVDARQHQESPLVERAEELFNRHRSELDIHCEIHALIAIAFGFCFFKGDLERADRYSLEALESARRNDLENVMALARITRVYRFTFEGRWKECRREVEACWELYQSPRVSDTHKSAILFLQLDLLEASGDFINFMRRKNHMDKQAENHLQQKSVFGPFIALRHIDYLTAQGAYQEALTFTRSILMDANINKTPHLHSQYLQYLALIAALCGDVSEALAAADLAVKERDQVGIPSYIGFNRLIVGAAYAVLGKHEEAERLFAQAIQISFQIGELAIRTGVYTHRAALRAKAKKAHEAIDDARSALQSIQRYQCAHFFGWTQEAMQSMLSLAVRHGIEPGCARSLAAERLGIALTDDGRVLPLLKIRTLGLFSIAIGPTTIIREQDLTRAQRRLLALLLASPGFTLDAGKIQEALWPEGVGRKSRSKLDTLVSRLRSALKKALGDQAAIEYFRMEKGVLAFTHCVCDATEFMRHARQGLVHAQKGESWQADNAFYTAHQLWEGEFMTGLELEDPAAAFRSEILNCYLDGAAAWCRILLDHGQLEEGVQAAECALAFEDINHTLVKLLYALYARQNNPSRAGQVVKSYRKALARSDFAPGEIDEIIESMWSDGI